MQECVLYQTLKDKGNYQQVVDEGPFICERPDAWLGKGYYFWELYIEFAHVWGRNAGYGDKYIIGQSAYDYDNRNFLDLVGNPIHKDVIWSVYKSLKDKQDSQNIDQVLTLSAVLMAFRKVLGEEFNFKAIRVRSEYKLWEFLIPFNERRPKNEVYNARPEIQICVLDKSFLTQPFRIVYPERG